MKIQPEWIYLFLGLLAGERLLELFIARRNERRLLAQGGREFGRSFSRVLFIFHGLWFLAFTAEAILDRSTPVVGPAAVLAAFLFLQVLRYWCIASLGPFWNTKIIVQPGAPRVRKGPYRRLKHPNYLVVRIEIALYPALLGCFFTALVFGAANVLMLRRRIRQEEQALQSLAAP